MEIIFTLILLIGFGINSHRYDTRKQELPKQAVTSFIQKEISKNINTDVIQQEIKSNAERKIHFETSNVIQKTETRDTGVKGKYISFRINGGKG